jgi:hypothetical protein
LAGKGPLSAALTRQNLDTTREHASLSIGFPAVMKADGSAHPHTAGFAVRFRKSSIYLSKEYE